MSKKMKVLIAVLVAIITLTVSGTVAVLAQDDEESELDEEELIEELDEIAPGLKVFASTVESDGLLSRVAEILGIPDDELSEAFAQAKQEMMAESCEKAFYEFLDRAVKEGLVTEEEAKEIKEWWEQKPDALNWNLLRKAFCMMRPHPQPLANNGWMDFNEIKRNIQERLKEFRKPELRTEMLEEAIEEGLIDEEAAADIKAWAGNKPATLNQLSPKPRIMKAVRGRHMIAVPEGRQGAATIPGNRLDG